MPGRPLPKSKLYEENRFFMATTILIIATSRSALFKIKRATRARSETRLPCRSSPFVSVLPVVGPQIPMNRSLPPRTTILFSRDLPEKRGVHKKRPTRLSALRALPARSAGRRARSSGWGKAPRASEAPQWMGADPSYVTTLIGSITYHFAICDKISQVAYNGRVAPVPRSRAFTYFDPQADRKH